MRECLTEIKGRQYHLEFEPVVFNWFWDRNLKGRHCLILSWLYPSQFKNIVFLRVLIFHLGWPWITYNAVVTDWEDEGGEE